MSLSSAVTRDDYQSVRPQLKQRRKGELAANDLSTQRRIKSVVEAIKSTRSDGRSPARTPYIPLSPKTTKSITAMTEALKRHKTRTDSDARPCHRRRQSLPTLLPSQLAALSSASEATSSPDLLRELEGSFPLPNAAPPPDTPTSSCETQTTPASPSMASLPLWTRRGTALPPLPLAVPSLSAKTPAQREITSPLPNAASSEQAARESEGESPSFVRPSPSRAHALSSSENVSPSPKQGCQSDTFASVPGKTHDALDEIL